MMKLLPSSIPLYIGLTTHKKVIGAQEAAEEPLKQYHCLHCQKALTLENNNVEYCFIHLDKTTEYNCVYCLREYNKITHENELAIFWSWLSPLIKETRWRCVLCEHDYNGIKQCPVCTKGIYSIPAPKIRKRPHCVNQ